MTFPDISLKVKRTAYGRNGKGRHSLFCFSDEYWVETWKNGISSLFSVKRSKGEVPYRIEFLTWQSHTAEIVVMQLQSR